MKKSIFAVLLVSIFSLGCKKQALEPEIIVPVPTMSFQKSSSYADQRIVTPDKLVLLFEGKIVLKNGPVYVQPIVTIAPADETMPVIHSSIKNVYVTISGSNGQSNKKNPTQSAMEFDETPLNYDGSYTIRVYATIIEKVHSSIMTSMSLSYSWDDPVTKKLYIQNTATIKGQTISFDF